MMRYKLIPFGQGDSIPAAILHQQVDWMSPRSRARKDRSVSSLRKPHAGNASGYAPGISADSRDGIFINVLNKRSD
jgi:hypothetical protein